MSDDLRLIDARSLAANGRSIGSSAAGRREKRARARQRPFLRRFLSAAESYANRELSDSRFSVTHACVTRTIIRAEPLFFYSGAIAGVSAARAAFSRRILTARARRVACRISVHYRIPFLTFQRRVRRQMNKCPGSPSLSLSRLPSKSSKVAIGNHASIEEFI